MKRNNAAKRIGRWLKIGAVAVCIALPLTGGWCQRYQDQSDRTENMRHYYDSVLRAERNYKDSVSRALLKEERKRDSVLRKHEN